MDDETSGTGGKPPESPITPPGEGPYEDVSGSETTAPSGAGSAAEDEATSTDVESDEAGADAGGKAHTSTTEGHPAGEGERTDRDVGGPKSDA